MASITGFGGAFVRANDPEALYRWYERHLGLVMSEVSFAFPASAQRAQVVFAFFGQGDEYFPPTHAAILPAPRSDGTMDGVAGTTQQTRSRASCCNH
jgi:hypothetical protein